MFVRYVNVCKESIKFVNSLDFCQRIPIRQSALLSTCAFNSKLVTRPTLHEHVNLALARHPRRLVETIIHRPRRDEFRLRECFGSFEPRIKLSSYFIEEKCHPRSSDWHDSSRKLPSALTIDIEDIPYKPYRNSLQLPSFNTCLNLGRVVPLPVDIPTAVNNHEKHAARLIVIRRRKMKKHKLKKLRKKMKFEWAKVRQRREMRKEKAFQAELLAQIKEAEKFDAAQYVAEKLWKAHEVPIPRRWKGKRLPQFIIKEKLGIK